MGKVKAKTPKKVKEKKSEYNEWKQKELYDVQLKLDGNFKLTDQNTIQLACKGDKINMPDKTGKLTDCTLFVIKDDGNKQEIKLDANILGLLKLKGDIIENPAQNHPPVDAIKESIDSKDAFSQGDDSKGDHGVDDDASDEDT